MSVVVREISDDEYRLFIDKYKKETPLWLLPSLVTCYKDKKLLVAQRGQQMVGFWVVPLDGNNLSLIARREFRYLPYCSPFLLDNDNLKRREVMEEFFKLLIRTCDQINLPFGAGFTDLAAIQGLGGYVEWRHTHHLENFFEDRKIPSRLRNHIKYAKDNIEIIKTSNHTQFDFIQAIKGTDQEQETRKRSAINLLNNDNAAIFVAFNKNEICSGIFVAFDANSAYLMHSWQTVNTPRGTISALIYEAAKWVLDEKKLKVFDFEGSVVQAIDYYYSGFNCKIIPYGHVFWSKDKEGLYKMIDRSINIPGRITL